VFFSIQTSTFSVLGDFDMTSSQQPLPPRSSSPVSPRFSHQQRDQQQTDLTEQQRAIVSLAAPPQTSALRDHEGGRIFRVTAGAGTGKTTTLLHLADALLKYGNTVCYCAFNTAAITDVTERIARFPGFGLRNGFYGYVESFKACTLHSLACKSREDRNSAQLADRTAVFALIDTECKKDLDDLVLDVSPREHIRDHEKRKRAEARAINTARKNARKFVFKTLDNFLHSSRPGLSADDVFYPAKLWHEGKNENVKTPAGLPPLTGKFANFYERCAGCVWNKLRDPGGKWSFDSVMKEAQLAGEMFPGCYNVVLVDESQDLDEAQIDWTFRQAKLGTDVYYVGDAAQAIYGFRHARPQLLLELGQRHTRVEDLKLTHSFRFGQRIADVANMVLHVKEHCRGRSSSSSSSPHWMPYRLTGAGAEPEEGRAVSFESEVLKEPWRNRSPDDGNGRSGPPAHQFTLLARTNAQLVVKALSMLGFALNRDDVMFGSCGDPIAYDRPEAPPRMTFATSGSGSGKAKLLKVVSEIKSFYAVYAGHSCTLDIGEWAGETDVTWNDIGISLKEGHGLEYLVHFTLVERLQHQTETALCQFQKDVLEGGHGENEADIILSTIHSAKGREWPVVELCDDVSALVGFVVTDVAAPARAADPPEFIGMNRPTPSADTNGPTDWATRMRRWEVASQTKRAKFALKDDSSNCINLWYVAVTRAKRRLVLPWQFQQLVQATEKFETFLANLGSENGPSRQKASQLDQATASREHMWHNFEPPQVMAIRDLLRGLGVASHPDLRPEQTQRQAVKTEHASQTLSEHAERQEFALAAPPKDAAATLEQGLAEVQAAEVAEIRAELAAADAETGAAAFDRGTKRAAGELQSGAGAAQHSEGTDEPESKRAKADPVVVIVTRV
jgi:superfamily I DNA/RNA helicase